MACRLWFCCSPRASARFVGILDLIVGVLGIALSVLLFIDSENVSVEDSTPFTMDDGSGANVVEVSRESYKQQGLGYFFPSVLTTLVGIAILIAVAKNNISFARLAYVLNILLIVGEIAVFVILFVMGIHWMTIFPILAFGLFEILLIFGVQEFIRHELSIESV